MEMLVLIVLLTHVIALLSVFGFAKFDAAADDESTNDSRDWMETCVPVRVPVAKFERR